jgi:ATP-dependent DNA helicase RecG
MLVTPEMLQAIVARGETLTVEFKGEHRQPLSDRQLTEAAVCLANRSDSEPAYLLVGVEDDGRVTGLRHRHGNSTDPLRMQALVSNLTQPALSCRAEIVDVDSLPVLVLEVPRSAVPIATTRGQYLRRTLDSLGKPQCRPLYYHEMISMQADRGNFDYSRAVIEGLSKEHDLDPLEIERYRRAIRNSGGGSVLLTLSDDELLSVIEATSGGRVTVLGLLLFGREQVIRRALPAHEIAFQELDGLAVRHNTFWRGPLLWCLEEILSRFRALNAQTEVQIGLFRRAIPTYSERAFREAVANAVVHRDYTRLHAVLVQLSEDRLEISSPGGLPQGVSVANLLVTPPQPRNRALADSLKRAGIVERTGRGVDLIFLEQLENGRPIPSYGQTTDTTVTVTLPGGAANLQFIRLVIEEGEKQRPLTLDQLLLLNLLWEQRVTEVAEAASRLQRSPQEARAQLERLVERGLVESRGERVRSYTLSRRIYAMLGQPLDADLEDQLMHLLTHKQQITRGEVAQQLGLKPDAAARLLKQLQQKGLLELRGERRGAHYVATVAR